MHIEIDRETRIAVVAVIKSLDLVLQVHGVPMAPVLDPIGGTRPREPKPSFVGLEVPVLACGSEGVGTLETGPSTVEEGLVVPEGQLQAVEHAVRDVDRPTVHMNTYPHVIT